MKNTRFCLNGIQPSESTIDINKRDIVFLTWKGNNWDGPHTSENSNSKGLDAIKVEELKDNRWLLAWEHAEHITKFLFVEIGSWNLDNTWRIIQKLGCPKQRCQFAADVLSPSRACGEVVGDEREKRGYSQCLRGLQWKILPVGMLLDMPLRISNIWLTCSDIICCSSRLKLWYELVMKNFEHDAKTDFYKGFFFFFLASRMGDVLSNGSS